MIGNHVRSVDPTTAKVAKVAKFFIRMNSFPIVSTFFELCLIYALDKPANGIIIIVWEKRKNMYRGGTSCSHRRSVWRPSPLLYRKRQSPLAKNGDKDRPRLGTETKREIILRHWRSFLIKC